MLKILFTALPTMVLIIGAYILLYKDTLQKAIAVKSSKGIIMCGITYFILSVLGFFTILNQYILLTYIWLAFVILFTLTLIYLFYKMSRGDK